MRDRSMNMRLLIRAVFLKWRRMLVFGLILAVLLGGWKAFRMTRSAVPEAENHDAEQTSGEEAEDSDASGADFDGNNEYFLSQIDRGSDYLNHSILAKIDPNREGFASVDLVTSLKGDGKKNIEDLIGELETSVRVSGNDDQTDAKTPYAVTSSSEEDISVRMASEDFSMKELLRAYRQFVLYDVDWSELAEKYHTEDVYLQELVSVSDAEAGLESGSLVISVVYPDEEGAGDILDEIIRQLKDHQTEVTEEYGEHDLAFHNQVSSTVADSDVTDWAAKRVKQMNDLMSGENTFTTTVDALGLKNSATGSAAGPVSASQMMKPVLKYAVAGFIGGIILYLVLGMIWILLSGVIFSAQELNRQYGFRRIAVIPMKNPDRWKGLDRFFRRDAMAYYSSRDQDVCYRMADENIRAIREGGGSLLLTGDLDRVQLEHIAGKLSTNSGITISAASGSLDSPEAIRSLKESDGVILAAEIGKSKYDHVDRILDTVHSLGKDVEGTILLN